MTAHDILRMALRRARYYAETGQWSGLRSMRRVIRAAWSKRHSTEIITFNKGALYCTPPVSRRLP